MTILKEGPFTNNYQETSKWLDYKNKLFYFNFYAIIRKSASSFILGYCS